MLIIKLIFNFRGIRGKSSPHEFTASTKTHLERVVFLTETKHRRTHEITYLRITKKLIIHENRPPVINNCTVPYDLFETEVLRVKMHFQYQA